MQKRIDRLQPGAIINLTFHPVSDKTERAEFLGIEGTGTERRARFRSLDGEGKSYEWEAYRYMGHWAYGTGADRLSLHSVELA